MTQKDIFEQTKTTKLFKEAYLKEKTELFIGRNFLEALDDIAKTENEISVQRNNVTFINHYPRRTKRPKIEVEKNRCRTNEITLPVKNKEWYKDFNTTIKDICLTTVITKNKNLLDDNKEIGCVTGLHFILDDTEELIIENQSRKALFCPVYC